MLSPTTLASKVGKVGKNDHADCQRHTEVKQELVEKQVLLAYETGVAQYLLDHWKVVYRLVGCCWFAAAMVSC